MNYSATNVPNTSVAIMFVFTRKNRGHALEHLFTRAVTSEKLADRCEIFHAFGCFHASHSASLSPDTPGSKTSLRACELGSVGH